MCLGLNHAQSIADAATPQTILEQTETADILRDAVGGLIRSHRQVLTLRHGHDMTYEEIGRHMRISASAAFQLHQSAIQKLRISLDLMGAGTRFAFAW